MGWIGSLCVPGWHFPCCRWEPEIHVTYQEVKPCSGCMGWPWGRFVQLAEPWESRLSCCPPRGCPVESSVHQPTRTDLLCVEWVCQPAAVPRLLTGTNIANLQGAWWAYIDFNHSSDFLSMNKQPLDRLIDYIYLCSVCCASCLFLLFISKNLNSQGHVKSICICELKRTQISNFCVWILY